MLVIRIRHVVVPITDDGETGGGQFHAEPQALQSGQVQIDDFVGAGQALRHFYILHVHLHIVNHRLRLDVPMLLIQHSVRVVPHPSSRTMSPEIELTEIHVARLSIDA